MLVTLSYQEEALSIETDDILLIGEIEYGKKSHEYSIYIHLKSEDACYELSRDIPGMDQFLNEISSALNISVFFGEMQGQKWSRIVYPEIVRGHDYRVLRQNPKAISWWTRLMMGSSQIAYYSEASKSILGPIDEEF